MGDVLTEQHLVPRDRMGRLLGFLARQIQDGRTPTALGFAVNERTSVVVDKKGVATVMGDGPAYLVLADHFPERCEPKQPLSYSDFKIWRFETGESFSLRNRPRSGFYTISVTDGVLSGDPY
jgi:cyanophycinase-like exopeptidase